jgi:two-component system nitrogen regulation response regulator GlnG
MLVQYYLRRFSRSLGREVREVSPEAFERLQSYSWPGNIRELQSVLKQALLRASGTVLLPSFLPELLNGPCPAIPSTSSGEALDLEAFIRQRLAPEARDLYAETHREVDRLLLTLVLEFTHGSQHQAARLLGIARQTLRLKLRELGLYVTRSVETEEDDQT